MLEDFDWIRSRLCSTSHLENEAVQQLAATGWALMVYFD